MMKRPLQTEHHPQTDPSDSNISNYQRADLGVGGGVAGRRVTQVWGALMQTPRPGALCFTLTLLTTVRRPLVTVHQTVHADASAKVSEGFCSDLDCRR